MSRDAHNPPASRTHRCALRHRARPAERTLWAALRREQVDGWRFRRQYGVGPFLVDVYCPAGRLGVEEDGAVRDDPARAAYDSDRQRRLETDHEVRILRFRNDEVMTHLDLVVEAMRVGLNDGAQSSGLAPLPASPRWGEEMVSSLDTLDARPSPP